MTRGQTQTQTQTRIRTPTEPGDEPGGGSGGGSGGGWNEGGEARSGGVFPPSHSRGRVLATAIATVVALGLVSAAVVLVAGAGSGDGTDSGAARTPPTRVAPPQLPGLDGPGDATDDATPPPSSDPSGQSSDPSDQSSEPSSGGESDSESGGAPSMWAGPGCTAPSGRYREEGRFENGEAAWYTVREGGHQGDSCDGRFSAVPMSGSEDRDGDSSATWSFELGKAYKTYEKCALAVHVPDTGRDRDVAGRPTFYKVLADPSDDHSTYAAFAVRQTVHRGSLVKVGSYAVKGDTFTVRMLDRGQDWGREELVGAHHAAAQMRLDCR